MQLIPNMPSPSQPSTQVETPLVLYPSAFRANPTAVASERQHNTVVDGLLGATLGGIIGYTMKRRQPDATSAILTGTALGGVLGGALGYFQKTGEEAYAHILSDAARSHDFAGHVKKEMKRRENEALVTGALIGLPIFW